MRTIWLAATAALALAACNETPEPAARPSAPATVATTNAKVEPVPTETAKPSTVAKPAPVAEPEASTEDSCGKSKVAPFIGRQDRPTTRADLAKAVGHDNIRWIGPDDAVTMDFSEGRLNVLLDATKRLITGARCG